MRPTPLNAAACCNVLGGTNSFSTLKLTPRYGAASGAVNLWPTRVRRAEVKTLFFTVCRYNQMCCALEGNMKATVSSCKLTVIEYWMLTHQVCLAAFVAQ